MAAVVYPCCQDRMILAAGIHAIPVVRSEVIYVRVTSVTNLVLWVESHPSSRSGDDPSNIKKMCDLGRELLKLSSSWEGKDHDKSVVKTSTAPLIQSLSPCSAHF